MSRQPDPAGTAKWAGGRPATRPGHGEGLSDHAASLPEGAGGTPAGRAGSGFASSSKTRSSSTARASQTNGEEAAGPSGEGGACGHGRMGCQQVIGWRPSWTHPGGGDLQLPGDQRRDFPGVGRRHGRHMPVRDDATAERCGRVRMATVLPPRRLPQHRHSCRVPAKVCDPRPDPAPPGAGAARSPLRVGSAGPSGQGPRRPGRRPSPGPVPAGKWNGAWAGRVWCAKVP